MQHSIDARQIELVGIECAAQPRKHFGVFGIPGIANRLHKISVAPHPADIFRRTSALTVQTARIARALFGLQDFLDDDVMLPTIAEIVEIDETVRNRRRDARSELPDPPVIEPLPPTTLETGETLRRSVKYFDYGNLATIGRAKAIADFGWIRVSGYFAWLLWLFIHVLKLIGFRNRVLVLTQWAWAYFSYQRAVRLITGVTDRSEEPSA